MYIRIDLSVFFRRRTSERQVKWSFHGEKGENTFGVKETSKRNFSGEEESFLRRGKHSLLHRQKQTTKKTSSSFEEDVENLAKGVSHYCMMLQLTTKIKALFEAVKTFSSCTLLSLSS